MGNIDLGNGIYWIGLDENINELHCNAYLIIDNDEAVLFDPGSVLDFATVFENLSELVPLDRIIYIVLHHQDPDLCSSVPLFESKGMKVQIATHWRTSLLVKYYGIKSPFYIVNEHENRLVFSSGRELHFVPAPYLHFPGSIMTYDLQSGTLFSGDLFGAISAKWKPFADEHYMDIMKTFHEHYIPGNDALRPVMEILLHMNIKMICPQHGSIISESPKDYILTLRDLECGIFLNPVKRQLMESGGYTGICNAVLKRLFSVFGKEPVVSLFNDSDIQLDQETGLLKDFSTSGEMLWDHLFALLYSKRGIRWLTVIAPFVQGLSKEYSIEMPDIYSTAILDEQRKQNRLKDWNQRLIRLNKEFKKNIAQTQERLVKCSVTGLYNEEFFTSYLSEFLSSIEDRDISVLFIGVDNIEDINSEFGETEGDKILKGIAYLLLNEKPKNHYVFRLKGPNFAYIIPENDRDFISLTADKYRTAVEKSDLFIKPVTISVGAVSLDEKIMQYKDIREQIDMIFAVGKARLERARELSGNQVCMELDLKEQDKETGRAVIIEYDAFQAELLKTALETIGIKSLTCLQGSKAVQMIKKFHPDVILSEIYLTELDVFQIREDLMESTREKTIPFILISHQKDETSVVRAQSLGIYRYFKKPYIIPEIIGIVDHIVRGKQFHDA